MNFLICPGCHKKIKFPNKLLGKQVRCPNCKQSIQLPAKGKQNVGKPATSVTSGNDPQTPKSAQANFLPTSELASPKPAPDVQPTIPGTSDDSTHNRYASHPDETQESSVSNRLPLDVKVEQSQNQLVIDIRNKPLTKTIISIAILFGAIVPGTMGFQYAVNAGELFSWGGILVGFVFSILIGLCGVLGVISQRKQVTLIVDRTGIEKVSSVWFLPWLKKSRRFSRDEIIQIYTVETERTVRVEEHINKDEEHSKIDAIAGMFQSAEDRENERLRNIRVRYVKKQFYGLFLLHRNGWRYELVRKNLLDRLASKIVEQKIEGFIQIQNQPVRSKWYQRLFHGELTLSEKTNHQGADLCAKSIWMPAGMMTALGIFLVVGCMILWWGIANNWDLRSWVRRNDGIIAANNRNSSSTKGQKETNRNAIRRQQSRFQNGLGNSVNNPTGEAGVAPNELSAKDFVFPDLNDPNRLPIWGLKNGIRIGLSPTPGPQGLIRIYAPYLGQKYPRMVNYISIEPSVAGQTGRDQSELQESRFRPGEKGLSFWASNSLDDAKQAESPVAGEIDPEQGLLRVFVHCEPFQNGAAPIVECVFDKRHPYEVKLVTHAAKTSKPMEWCTLSATMGNFGLLNQLQLGSKTVSARDLWASDRIGRLGFLEWRQWRSNQLMKGADGRFLVEFSSDLNFDNLRYDSSVPNSWRYTGTKAVHYWRAEKGSNPIAAANGRKTYWGTTSPIPNNPSFENTELRIRFKSGNKLWFGVRPDDM